MHVGLLLLLAAVPEPLDARLLREGPAALAKAARESGDPGRGAVLFHQPQLSCVACHACGSHDNVSPLGPDLARPLPGTTAAAVVESVLAPSAHVRPGYEAVAVTRGDGRTVTGLLVSETADALTLRDPADPTKPVVIPKADIDARGVGKISLMPTGLVNLLADRQQALDLFAYLIEAAEFGPGRARSLKPDPATLNPPLPAYESDLDHAALVRESDAATLKRGEELYARQCATCHGTPTQPGTMPTSVQFWNGQFRNGRDPLSLYRTLTHGFGQMAARPDLLPRQKYDAVHYLRETFLKPLNPSQYVAADAAYLAGLPKGTSRGPAAPPGDPWKRADYGPSLSLTVEVSPGNIAYKGVAVRLDPGPGGVAAGTAWAVYDHDTLRLVGGWTGSGFIDWNGINFNGRHGIHPKIVGKLELETPPGPGWADPDTGSFRDPRPLGRDGKPYGPLPRRWGRFRGLQTVGERVILSYTVGDTPVRESTRSGFARTFEVGPRPKPLAVRHGREVRELPAGEETLRFTLGGPPAELPRGGGDRWPETVTTTIERGADSGPFAADTLTLPDKNPWNVQVRPTGLDFLPGGDLVVCTWDGDVWRAAERGSTLTWRRIASGLFQPLGLKVVGDTVYVGCRDQIAVLRGDGLVECFNSDHQVTESFHEFAMGLQTDAAGNFLYAKGARHGKPAVVPHHGTLLRVGKDGASTEIVATGFRAPNGVCVNPDGTVFLTDQEGFWVPKNRINWVRPGDRFFGNLGGYTSITDRSDAAQEEPLCWLTNRFDRSPAEPVWVNSKSWGGLDGALLNTSYGTGQLYVVPHERAGDGMHGGAVHLPLPPFPTGVMRGRFGGDGHLYLCGLFSWAGNRTAPGGLYRLRATGKPATLPVGYHVAGDTLALTFSDPVSGCDAADCGLKVWDLHRSEKYGSPHLNERPLQVTAAVVSDDKRTVTLTVPGLGPTRGLELWYTVRRPDGTPVDGLFHGSVGVRSLKR